MHRNSLLKDYYIHIKYNVTPPSRKSVWCIVSELFAKTCHSILQSFVWKCHISVPQRDTNMWRLQIIKTSGAQFVMTSLSFCSRAELNEHKHVFYSSDLPKITRQNCFNQTTLSQLLSWCHRRYKCENSKCCILRTKNATGPKTGKNIYF